MMNETSFEWDEEKNIQNQNKHGISFEIAQNVFLDTSCVIAEDLNHSYEEKRYFCFGLVDAEVITVRFTYRYQKIRIFGAGYWRKGRKIYEKENSLYR
jgi:uncharacterized DUF497 family protein